MTFLLKKRSGGGEGGTSSREIQTREKKVYGPRLPSEDGKETLLLYSYCREKTVSAYHLHLILSQTDGIPPPLSGQVVGSIPLESLRPNGRPESSVGCLGSAEKIRPRCPLSSDHRRPPLSRLSLFSPGKVREGGHRSACSVSPLTDASPGLPGPFPRLSFFFVASGRQALSERWPREGRGEYWVKTYEGKTQMAFPSRGVLQRWSDLGGCALHNGVCLLPCF